MESGDEVAVWLVMALAPLLTGALKVTVACASPALAVLMMGAPGIALNVGGPRLLGHVPRGAIIVNRPVSIGLNVHRREWVWVHGARSSRRVERAGKSRIQAINVDVRPPPPGNAGAAWSQRRKSRHRHRHKAANPKPPTNAAAYEPSAPVDPAMVTKAAVLVVGHSVYRLGEPGMV
jgi:hypothetical protein